MADTLIQLSEAEKTIWSPSDWTSRGGGKLELRLPLAIDGAIEEGLILRCCALEHLPDEEVVFQLEYHGLRVRGGTGAMSRVEWNPVRTHNNKGKGPVELRFVEQRGTHVHHFSDNWRYGEEVLMKGNLPIARPVSQPFQGFDGCLDFVGKLFRINDIDVIKPPEWVVRLAL